MSERPPAFVDPVAESDATEESINLSTASDFFAACEENRDLLRDISLVVPVRPMDGINCELSRKLAIWYGEGMAFSHLNDHMGGFIECTRANIAYSFLKSEDKQKYLLMIDNDMEPELDLPLILGRHDAPVVGGCAMSVDKKHGPMLCFTVPDDAGGYRFPALHQGKKIPAKGLKEVGHIGTGAILIRRDVLEAFSFESDDIPFYVPESVRMQGARTGNLLIGEDIAFCNAVRAKGFKMYVDLEAHVGHRKTMALTWDADRRDPNMDAETWTISARGAKEITAL